MKTERYLVRPYPHNLLAQRISSGWAVVQVRSGDEERVLTTLRRLPDCHYVDLQIESTRHYSRYRQRTTLRKFLPGYLIVRSDDLVPDQLFEPLRPLISINPVRDGEEFLEELIHFCHLLTAAGDGDIERLPGYATGDLVEVICGPLAGCRGRIVKRRGRYELVVGLTILGTTVRSHIDITSVQPVTAR